MTIWPLDKAAPTRGLEYAVLPFVGGFTLAQAVASLTKVQLVTGADLRGRVIALYFMVSAAGSASGGVVLGTVAQRWNPRWAIGMSAVLAFALGDVWLHHGRRWILDAVDVAFDSL
jgi:hypothetical protein